MQELLRAGAEMRTHTPHRDGPHGFPIMHAKTIVIDEKVGYFGSVNATYNGLTLSKEVVLQVTETQCLRDARADFEATWLKSDELTAEKIQEAAEKVRAKAEAAEHKTEEKAQEKANKESEMTRRKLANRGNQLLGKTRTSRVLEDEYAESDTPRSESLVGSDTHELQPCALALGGGYAAEARAAKMEIVT